MSKKGHTMNDLKTKAISMMSSYHDPDNLPSMAYPTLSEVDTFIVGNEHFSLFSAWKSKQYSVVAWSFEDTVAFFEGQEYAMEEIATDSTHFLTHAVEKLDDLIVIFKCLNDK